MSKSKYKKHKKEISEMKAKGKTNAAISKILNKKDKDLKADQNSLKVFLKREKDKKNEKKQTHTTKTVPENQEGVQEKKKPKKDLPEKIKEPVANKAPVKVSDKDIFSTPQQCKENCEIFSIINDEFGENVEKSRDVAMRKARPFFITGIWLLTVVISSLGDAYITRCLPRRDAWLVGVPVALSILLGLNIMILYKTKMGEYVKKVIVAGIFITISAVLTVLLTIYIPGRTGAYVGAGLVGLTFLCVLFPKKKGK